MYAHKFFAILINSFIFSDSVVSVFVYVWDFLLTRQTGRYQREEDGASAWDWVESAIFNRVGTIQKALLGCISPPDGKFPFSQELRHLGKEGKDKKCHFLKSHLFTKKTKKWVFYYHVHLRPTTCRIRWKGMRKFYLSRNVGRGIRGHSIYRPQANKLQWTKIVQVIQRRTAKELSLSEAAQCSN